MLDSAYSSAAIRFHQIGQHNYVQLINQLNFLHLCQMLSITEIETAPRGASQIRPLAIAHQLNESN